MHPTKKLIEVALPLETINKESAREKSIRHGHPSTLHLWWARRPLAACRAVLFASIVDDPEQEGVPEKLLREIDKLPIPQSARFEWKTMTLGEQRRQKLFGFIEKLVQWENSNDDGIIGTARVLIRAATGGNPPPVYDPFAGGGSIPLEAQRLGLEAHASDLNPVAVLINKGLIEIPPKFANMPPVSPINRNRIDAAWKGAAGLAADVRYYGKWMRDEAEKRIGHFYPKVKLPKEHGDGEATVIAWLWARTVKCPNPACGAQMPLVRSFALSTKKGKEAWVEPVIDRLRSAGSRPPNVRFTIHNNTDKPPEGTVSRKGARCVVCDTPVPLDHVRIEGRAGRMGAKMLAIVAEGKGGRIYLPPNEEHETIAAKANPEWKPEELVTTPSHDVDRLPMYGMQTWGDAFTPRQLVAMTTFNDLVNEVRDHIQNDAVMVGLKNEGSELELADTGAKSYANAITTYLAFGVDKAASRNCTLTIWEVGMGRLAGAFGRQVLPMTWSFAETNPLAGAGGDILGTVESVCEVLDNIKVDSVVGRASQRDAADIKMNQPILISTDPPYYDNVGYADLSDFFYVWLRRSARSIYPDLFSTLLAPKSQELIASAYRFEGDRKKAEEFFEQRLGVVFSKIRLAHHPDYPLTIYYAFKQTETTEDDDKVNGTAIAASTGWETMLQAVMRAGFSVTGTWPVRSELTTALKKDIGALASSIVLVCRPRSEDARPATRREFLSALQRELPEALRLLQKGNIAPVDLAQAAIGPGMAVFSRYSKVVEADGKPMRVRSALQLINQELDTVLAEQEGDYDNDTRWAVAWFEQQGMSEAPYGVAETLSTAKNTSVAGMVEAGFLYARAGKVRLLKREELEPDWDPASDRRMTAWEITQYLTRALLDTGETGAAELLAKIGGEGEMARELAYRLYTTCERKGWTQEALAYNSLVVSWPEISRLAAEETAREPRQGRMEI